MKLFVDQNTPRVSGQKQFQLEEWIEGSPFEALLGVEIVEAAEGRAVLKLPFTVRLANGGGVMHGGAMTTLADTAVVMAIKSLLPERTLFATTTLSIDFIAPVNEGTVTARARVTGTEKRTFHGECELCGEGGELYAKMTTVFKLLRSE